MRFLTTGVGFVVLLACSVSTGEPSSWAAAPGAEGRVGSAGPDTPGASGSAVRLAARGRGLAGVDGDAENGAVAAIDGVCSDELRFDHVDPCAPPAAFSDLDGDGEHDATDRCPETAAGVEVDAAGCSQAQFCAALPIHHWRDARFCRFVDWRNDETFRAPRDCRLSDSDTGFLCVAR